MKPITITLTKDKEEKKVEWLINLEIKNIKQSFKILNSSEDEIIKFFDEVIKYLTSSEMVKYLKVEKDNKKSKILNLPEKNTYPDEKSDEINYQIINEFFKTFENEVYKIIDDFDNYKKYLN